MMNSVKAKISLVYTGLVAVIVLLGLIAIFYMSRISDTIDGLIVANYNSIQRLNKMTEVLNKQDAILFSYLYSVTVEPSQKLFDQQTAEFYEPYDEENAVIFIPKEVAILHGIDRDYREYLSMYHLLFSLFDVEDPSELLDAREYFNRYMVPQLEAVLGGIRELYNCNETSLFARRNEAADMARHSAYVMIVLFSLAAIIGLWLSRIYTNRFLRPLYEITQTIKSVGQGGSVNRKTFINTQDEFGLLSREFNKMTQRLDAFERSTLGSLMDERNRSIAIVRSITEPLVVLDSQYLVVLLNESFEKLFDIPLSSVAGRSFFQMIEENGKLAEYFADVDIASAVPKDLLILAKEEQNKYYNITITPISEHRGTIIALHDITEMKLLDKAKNDFVATVSHEFKTPLTSIVMGVDLLSNANIGPLNDAQAEIISAIKEDGERLSRLVYDLLELSKIESSLTIYKFESCDLSPILERAAQQFSPLAERGGVTLTLLPHPPLPPVRADQTKIKWVLNNLLSNAVKYTRPGDTIELSAERQDDSLLITVSDSGVGISADRIEHMFERYIQIKSYEIEMRGSGLGLALSKEIIDAHGGAIWCKSEEGKGSAFTFRLPLLPPETH